MPFTRSAPLAGVLFLLLGIAVFSLQDLILKLLSGRFPLYQILLVRGLVSLPLLLLIVRAEGGLRLLVTPGLPAMLGRGMVLFVAYAAFYLSLAALPLPTSVALYFSGPLFITLLSAKVLRERVGLVAWGAVLVGFAGVLVLLRPGSGLFDWASMLPVLAGLAYGISMIAARRMSATETAGAMAFWSNAVFLTIAAVMGLALAGGSSGDAMHPSLTFLLRGWEPVALADFGLMAATGAIAAIGLWLLTTAYRLAEASTVAPFEYTAIVWGVVWGWTMWGEFPDVLGWAGIAIIVGAGLVMVLVRPRSARRPFKEKNKDFLPRESGHS
jgi:drug/metabolite transporter (DMT)-like permease